MQQITLDRAYDDVERSKLNPWDCLNEHGFEEKREFEEKDQAVFNEIISLYNLSEVSPRIFEYVDVNDEELSIELKSIYFIVCEDAQEKDRYNVLMINRSFEKYHTLIDKRTEKKVVPKNEICNHIYHLMDHFMTQNKIKYRKS